MFNIKHGLSFSYVMVVEEKLTCVSPLLSHNKHTHNNSDTRSCGVFVFVFSFSHQAIQWYQPGILQFWHNRSELKSVGLSPTRLLSISDAK